MISLSGIGEFQLCEFWLFLVVNYFFFIIVLIFWVNLFARVVVQGQGPGPRYGHVMDLVAQRYLVTVSGNDGMNISFSCFILSILWCMVSFVEKTRIN